MSDYDFPQPICPLAEPHAKHRIDGTWRDECPGVPQPDGEPKSWHDVGRGDVIMVRHVYRKRRFGMRVETVDAFHDDGTGYAYVIGQRLAGDGQPSRLPGNLGRRTYRDRTRRELIYLGDVQSWKAASDDQPA